MIRRFGDTPAPGRRYRQRPGAYAILPLRGRILLTFQASPAPEFQLPGGGIDPGESPVAALHREAFEETGWKITAPRRLGAFRRFTYMPEYDLWAEKLCHIYVATPTRRLGPPTEPGHAACLLDGEEALHRLANDGDRHFLARFLKAGRNGKTGRNRVA
ncbi:RNA pyrophosphohydrolase [Pseudoruegeria aquimaris]|uniref:RNA pyrophosphohydrolase n=1 Tax=Pseudoruegeria aquimaris TaxID=393663 RepID=A0A1Y5RT59_9RHOB|nr:NUDIX hydrolase [Pseudoruegeria aquimaris]SLN24788.1 RNA pyrophosphohydrolase [Pseudoruegeria aquimaris]